MVVALAVVLVSGAVVGILVVTLDVVSGIMVVIRVVLLDIGVVVVSSSPGKVMLETGSPVTTSGKVSLTDPVEAAGVVVTTMTTGGEELEDVVVVVVVVVLLVAVEIAGLVVVVDDVKVAFTIGSLQ